MRNDGVLAEIRQVPKSLLQRKSGKIGQNVILQKVFSISFNCPLLRRSNGAANGALNPLR